MHRTLLAAGTAFAIVSVTATASALPPPTAEVQGDSMRTIRWNPPVAIPGLSAQAKFWIAATQNHCLPSHFAYQYYVQRANALKNLVSGAEFRTLIGTRDARDTLVPTSIDPTDPNAQYRQNYQPIGATEAVPVSSGVVTLNLTADGTRIASLSSYFIPNFAAPAPSVSLTDAIGDALAAVDRDRFDVDAASTVAPLIALRVRWLEGVPVPPSFVGGDHLYYRVTLYNSRAPEVSRVEVLVDASTGAAGDVRFLSEDGSGLSPFVPNATVALYPPAVDGSLLNAFACQLFDGTGVDVNGQARSFSTSIGLGGPLPLGAPFTPYSMVSCGEGASRGIFFRDVTTFGLSTFPGATQVLADPFRDNDNNWTAPVDDPKRHAVNSQFWGERILRYFHGLEYVTRKSVATRVRFWAAYNDLIVNNYAEDAGYLNWQNVTVDQNGQVIGADFVGNGLILYGGAGAVLRTAGDPGILAHEFAHSVAFDHILFGNVESTEMEAIDEGLADTFSMLVLAANLPDLGFGYNSLGQDAPFHIAAGAYFDAANFEKGYPNLEDPVNSITPFDNAYHYWASTLTNARHPDSTLISGPLKLLVTGGKNPTLTDKVVVPGDPDFPSLGLSGGQVNRVVAYERLGELLMDAIRSGWVQANTTYADFIEALASRAGQLGLGWGAGVNFDEKVRRAFDAYGFGRIHEGEPNDFAAIAQLGDQAAKNAIAVGGGYNRPISGAICDNDEDFFVLNEKASGRVASQGANADEIQFSISGLDGSTYDVRVYQFEPCSFNESPTTGSCQHMRRIYPPADAPIQSPPEQNPPPFSVIFPSSGATGGGQTLLYRPIFIGVRRFEGNCQSSYSLKAKVIRKAGNEIY
jgi:hypothetical protein